MTDSHKTKQQKLYDLRKSYLTGSLSHVHFLLKSAALYIELKLPKRARVQIEHIDSRVLSENKRDEYINLKNRTIPLCSTPYQICSLNMVVKNEELNICRALDSIDTIMDEIVICDTGSIDQTIKLAVLYGSVIIEDPWKENFSIPRNKAIEASTGDWIFWMDGDDVLESSSKELIQNLWRYSPPQGALFTIRNKRKYSTPIDFIQTRLFPRNKNIRFQQSIHEQIMYSIAHEKIPFKKHPSILIHHTGYETSKLYIKKIMRNKRLIVQEIKKNPTDPTLKLGLADCFFSLHDHKSAEQLYISIIKSKTAWQKNSDVYIQAHTNLANLYIKTNKHSKAKKCLFHILYLDISRIEASFLLGKIFLDKGNESKAIRYFMKSAQITPPIRMTAVDTHKIKMDSIYFLVSYLIKFERYEEALPILNSSIKIYPMVPQYQTQLGQLWLKQKKLKKAAIAFSNSLSISSINNNDAYKGLSEIYSILGDTITSSDYLKQMIAA